MKKVAIVTDSTAVMGLEFITQQEHLYTIPLQILFDEEVYRDGIDLTSEQFFKKIEEVEVLPTTSQPSVGMVLDLFETLVTKYDEILYITISSNISGTYNSGLLAKNQMSDFKIEVFDSLNTSVIQNMLVKEAVSLANKGTSVDSIIKTLKHMRTNSCIYLVVDDLKHLGRTGRVNNMGAIVGALLKIKPILTFENGYINLKTKVRTLKKAYLELLEIIGEAKLQETSKIMIAHADGLENAKKMQEAISIIYPKHQIEIAELSPVISVHTGPNTVGVAWIK